MRAVAGLVVVLLLLAGPVAYGMTLAYDPPQPRDPATTAYVEDGSGNDVTFPLELLDQPYPVTVTATEKAGKRCRTIATLWRADDPDAEYEATGDVLTATTNRQAPTMATSVTLDPGEGSYFFDVTSTCDWTIAITGL